MAKSFFRLLAWLVAIAIVIATLSPLDDRPRLPTGPAFERAGAYFLLGICIWLGYRPRWTIMIVIVLVTTIGLEAAQLLTRDRHAEIVDGFVKAVGELAGVGAGLLLVRHQNDRGDDRLRRSKFRSG